MDATIVKRLHISGLTPALTSDDISRRLSTFGTVKAIDGFGLPDGLGQPRRFGYITLETTQGQLSRCLNLLSGSTWKGAKLRIGEAKPDFAERLTAEREAASHEPPKKKQRRYGGIEAADMSLVSPENVATRSGWTVTPLGRILRPMRMRPSHPLPPPNEDKKVLSKGKGGKAKKKARELDTRARRRTIDMTRYGSVHLKGMFLDMEMMNVGNGQEEKGLEVEVEVMDDSDDSDAEASQEKEEVAEEAKQSLISEVVKSVSPPAPTPPVNAPAKESLLDNKINIAAEKKQTLDLLASLFGNKDDADWVGRESVDSDLDETNIAMRHRMVVDADDDGDFEVVPMDADSQPVLPQKHSASEKPDEIMVVEKEVSVVPQMSTKEKQEVTKLKDLFAPREEDAGFSLLGHLDLDLELDDMMPFAIAESHPQEPTHSVTTAPSVPAPYVASQLDTKLPLFFPHCSLGDTSTKPRPKDVFDVAMENKWHWRDPAVEFYRTGTEEDIRKRWEESKVELTREWKKRWREAGKISRRRRMGDAGDS